MDTVLQFIVCVLAIYGVLSLAVSILNFIPVKARYRNGKIGIILMVKDSEEVIEGVIRSIFSGDIMKKAMSDGKLTVVDLGSKDGTVEILNRLRDNYVHMQVLEESEKENVFTVFDN